MHGLEATDELSAAVASANATGYGKTSHTLPLSRTDQGTGQCPIWIEESDLVSQPGSRQNTPANLGAATNPGSPFHQDSLLGLSSAKSLHREHTPMTLGLGLGSMLKNPARNTGVLDLGVGAKPSSRQTTPVSLSLAGVQPGTPLDAGFASIPEVGDRSPLEFSSTPQRTPLHEGFAKYIDRSSTSFGGMGLPFGMVPMQLMPLNNPGLKNIVEEKRAADLRSQPLYAPSFSEAVLEDACDYSPGALTAASVAPTPLNLGMFLHTRENTPVHPGMMAYGDRGASPQEDANDAPSVGSVGHPLSCSIACKYHHKTRGCKDGKNCKRCHLCIWTRACER